MQVAIQSLMNARLSGPVPKLASRLRLQRERHYVSFFGGTKVDGQ